MTVDGLNSLNLEYNLLNLTSGVRDMSDNLLAEYRWLADGTKAGVKGYENDSLTSGLEYLGSLVYKYVNDSLQLESAAFGGGRINKASNEYEISYFLTDHLGSTRATVNQSGTVTSRNNYLPFGMQWQYPNAQISDNRWLYNGKERQGLLGVDYSDFGWRMYDDKIGRWLSTDKKSEKYFDQSPYNYVGGNPIAFVDPWGLDYWYTNDPDQIKLALDALKRGNGLYTYGWEHVSDDDFLGRLYYNDETDKYWATWTTVENDVINVYSRSFSGLGAISVPYSVVYQSKSNIFGRFKESELGGTWVGQMLYGSLNQTWIMLQSLGGVRYPEHLEGGVVWPKERLEAGVMGLTNAIGPITSEIKAGAQVLNVAKYNKLHKGSGMNSRKGGGIHIRKANNAARQIEELEKATTVVDRTIDMGTSVIDNE